MKIDRNIKNPYRAGDMNIHELRLAKAIEPIIEAGFEVIEDEITASWFVEKYGVGKTTKSYSCRLCGAKNPIGNFYAFMIEDGDEDVLLYGDVKNGLYNGCNDGAMVYHSVVKMVSLVMSEICFEHVKIERKEPKKQYDKLWG